MKGMMKGKMMKKLKSIKPIEYLKAERILQASNFDEFVGNFPIKPNLRFPNFKDLDSKRRAWSKSEVPHGQSAAEAEVKEEQKEGKFTSKDESVEEEEEDKENIRPSISNLEPLMPPESSDPKQSTHSNPEPPAPLSEIDISSFRRPDMDSATLFDPNLLAAFREALIQQITAQEDQMKHHSRKTENEEEEEGFPLLNFEEKCPPGGIYSVILYSTSLRGIRKTFEDCQSVRFLLESFRVMFQERDISVHSEFREELWRTLGERCLPPRLFVMGRYIGGADQVLTLHEQGRLKPLFLGVPRNHRDTPCEGCAGFRFVVCFNCNGSTKVFDCDADEDDDSGLLLSRSRCTECNENGLIVCPYCC